MFRQRTTIFNPLSTHDNVVQKADQAEFAVQPAENSFFLVENKYTVSQSSAFSKFDLVKQLRIQSSDNSFPEDRVFNYRLSEGVNVYVTPQHVKTDEDKQEFFGQVRSLLNKLLDIEVNKENWTKSVNALHFHSAERPRLDVSILNLEKSSELKDSINFDLSYNSGSGVVFKQLYSVDSPLSIRKQNGLYKEIGLFLVDEQISSKDDVVLSGLRVVFGDDQEEENVFKTLFHTKPRHRYIDTGIDSHIEENGLHPLLHTSFAQEVTPPEDSDVQECNLYYYVSLNKSLIFDEFQSIPNGAKLVVNQGSRDLELPEYKVGEWGNEVLFEFANFSAPSIDFPLHSRYQKPSNETDSTEIYNSLPLIFYGCSVRDDYLLDKSPFDTKQTIGGNYESYFTNDTVFYHFTHNSGSSVVVNVPHGMSDFDSVNTITTIAVVIGSAIILFSLLKASFRSSTLSEKKKQ
ncbi:hypothetical protein G9P44_005890 [Scheffersomyces stipitis]|nr:hypothetical protein G9P44_005890 [Scheffersomyces stipitis]